MGLRTPLYERHLRKNAKMVDFSGWEMPIQYRGLIEEHLSVRNNVGMFDVSHMLTIDLLGKEAKTFVRFLLANDIEKISQGKAIYSCMLNTEAGIVDDLICYYFSDHFIRLVVNAGNRQSDVTWINRHIGNFQVELKVRDDLAMIAIQGPNARKKADVILENNGLLIEKIKSLKSFEMYKQGEWMVSSTGYTGEDGYEISMPALEVITFWDDLIKEDVIPCGLASRDTLRLEAGMHLYSQDMNQTTTPIESALMWTVSITDQRDFIGKAALIDKISQINNKLVGILLEGRGILRHGQKIFIEGTKETGVVTSGTFSSNIV